MICLETNSFLADIMVILMIFFKILDIDDY